MELDGYNEELKTAFEYQGIQHRKKAFGRSEEELRKIQEEDAYKLQNCKENGVILLQIPDDEILPYDDMQNFIVETYEKLSKKSLGNIPTYNWREFTISENEHAKKFRTYIEKKGGTPLSPYFTARKQVSILCQKGHQWTTTPDSIKRGNWCSECAGNKKGTTEEYRKIGKKFQCELENEYVNAKTPLRYRCQKGHVFKKTPYWLKRIYKEIKENLEKFKNICPDCEREMYAQKFEKFVRNKRGQVLTPYKGRFQPIKIKCEKKHEWETTLAVVYQGHWCRTCAKENDPNKKRKEAAEQEFLKMLQTINYSLLSNYENNTKQVQLKCNKKHTFPITPKYFKRLVTQKIVPCRKCRKKKN